MSRTTLGTCAQENQLTLYTAGKRLLLLSGFLILIYPYVGGYIGTRMACRADGGTTIFETAVASGYHDDTASGNCIGCVAMVGSGRFEFVDALAGLEWTRDPGLNRYIAVPIDDDRCEPWKRKPNWLTQARLRGVSENKCVVVEEVISKARYRYERSESTTLSWTALQIGTIEYRIMDTESDSVLGQHKMYFHTPWYAAALLDVKRTSTCQGLVDPYDSRAFISSILISDNVPETG